MLIGGQIKDHINSVGQDLRGSWNQDEWLSLNNTELLPILSSKLLNECLLISWMLSLRAMAKSANAHRWPHLSSHCCGRQRRRGEESESAERQDSADVRTSWRAVCVTWGAWDEVCRCVRENRFQPGSPVVTMVDVEVTDVWFWVHILVNTVHLLTFSLFCLMFDSIFGARFILVHCCRLSVHSFLS